MDEWSRSKLNISLDGSIGPAADYFAVNNGFCVLYKAWLVILSFMGGLNTSKEESNGKIITVNATVKYSTIEHREGKEQY